MAKNEPDVTKPIEHWCKSLGTPPAVYAGVTIQQGWLGGKMVTEAQYKAALAKFLTNGRRAPSA